jgi:hypothetical protein
MDAPKVLRLRTDAETAGLSSNLIERGCRYQSANVAAEKLRALSALASAQEPYLLQRTLRLSLSSLVRSQDTVRVVALVANNPIGTSLAWDFFRDHYGVLYERYGGGHFLIESLIKAVATHFSTHAKLAEVKQFFQGMYSRTRLSPPRLPRWPRARSPPR